MPGKRGQGRDKARPYGMWFKLKSPSGPIRTERWYANASDRNRAFAALKHEHGTKLLESGKLGK